MRGLLILGLCVMALGMPLQASADPTEIWSNVFNGAGDGIDDGFGVAIDSQGNTIVAGRTYTGTTNRTDGRAVKFTPSGTVHCSISMDSGPEEDYGTWGDNRRTSNDLLFSAAVDEQDNILLTGVYTGNFATNGYLQAAYTRKYDANCNPLWTPKIHYADAWNAGRDVAVDASRNVYVAGNLFNGWDIGEYVWAVWKYDEDGNLQAGFPILYDHNSEYHLADLGYGVAVDASGNIVVVGQIGVSGSPGSATRDYDWHVRKYNASRTLLWQDTYSGAQNLSDLAYKVAIDGNGDIIVVGYTNKGTDNSTNANYDWLVIKYAADGVGGVGQRLWTRSYAGTAGQNDISYGVSVDGSNNIWVAGYETDASGVQHRRLEYLDGTNGNLIDHMVWSSNTSNEALYNMAYRSQRIGLTGFVNNGVNNDAYEALFGLPSISVNPASYGFGSVSQGASSTPTTFTVTNNGTGPIVMGILSLGGTDPTQFALQGDTCSSQTLAAAGACTVGAVFSPTNQGAKGAILNVPSDDWDTPNVEVILTGTGTPPVQNISVSPTSQNFGAVIVGLSSVAQTFTVSNTGQADLQIGTIPLGGTDPGHFALLNDNCSNQTVGGASSCTFQGIFSPTTLGAKTAQFSIPSNDPDTPVVDVQLNGTGAPLPVNPDQGTIGTQVDLAGSGFGEKKPKAWLDAGGKALKWSVLGWTDSTVQALWKKKALPGNYDLYVQPKGKGILPILVGSFEIMLPEIASLLPTSGAPGTPVVLSGNYFGTPKKPKVLLSGGGLSKPKKCKVTSSSMTEIQFLTPKLPAGVYDVQVINKIGASALATGAFTVLAP